MAQPAAAAHLHSQRVRCVPHQSHSRRLVDSISIVCFLVAIAIAFVFDVFTFV
jgi:hypothetical protein